MIGLRFNKFPKIYKFITFLAACIVIVLTVILIANKTELKNSKQANFNSFPTPTILQIPEPTTTTVDNDKPKPTVKSEPAVGGCIISGCNGEICQDASDQAINSICVYRPEYDCYRSAKCEKQADGQCGWTQTDVLTMCLDKTIVGM